jgi:hypothetical protein
MSAFVVMARLLFPCGELIIGIIVDTTLLALGIFVIVTACIGLLWGLPSAPLLVAALDKPATEPEFITTGLTLAAAKIAGRSWTASAAAPPSCAGCWGWPNERGRANWGGLYLCIHHEIRTPRSMIATANSIQFWTGTTPKMTNCVTSQFTRRPRTSKVIWKLFPFGSVGYLDKSDFGGVFCQRNTLREHTTTNLRPIIF